MTTGAPIITINKPTPSFYRSDALSVSQPPTVSEYSREMHVNNSTQENE